MRFLLESYPLILGSVLLSGILLYLNPVLAKSSRKLEDLFNHKAFLLGTVSVLFVFFLAFYLFRYSYYVPYHGGVTGDNYHYAQYGFRNPAYYIPHHVYFPTVPATIIHGAFRAGWLDASAPMILEKLLNCYSIPNRLLALIGAVCAFHIFRRMRLTLAESWIGTFLLGVSFAYWFWSLQPNAIGFLLPFSCLTFFLTIYALEKERHMLYALASLATALCIYIHISSAYIVLGLSSVVVFSLFHRAHTRRSCEPLVQLLVYGVVAGLMAWGHLKLSQAHFRTTDWEILLSRLSDTTVAGEFHMNLEVLKRLTTGSLSTNLLLVFGWLQNPKTYAVEKYVVMLVLASLLTLGVHLIRRIRFQLPAFESHIPFYVLGVAFLFANIGFALRVTWIQYFAAIAPLTVLLGVGIVFTLLRPLSINPAPALVLLLALCTFFGNGFGQQNVFAGTRLDSEPVYRTLNVLKVLSRGKPVLFYGSTETDPYNVEAIMDYYKHTPRLSDIVWKDPAPLQQVLSAWKGEELYVNAADITMPSMKQLREMKIYMTDVQTTSPDYPRLYKIDRMKPS